MAFADDAASVNGGAATRFYAARSLGTAMTQRWREFADDVPWAHYRQDPAWAEIERDENQEPWFFWSERDGQLRLTALGLRRRLPVPGRVFWEFPRGPTFRELEDLDEWLPGLLTRVGREVARLRLSPPVPLHEGGDDVETLLERHGLVRRRVLGGWATLVADIAREETDIMRSFRSATQRAIKKSLRLGIEVREEDVPSGWDVLAALETELARRTPVSPARPADIERTSRLWLRDGAGGTVLVARHQGEPLAAALVVTHHGTAHLPMIPSSHRQRELPATHLLVWEAMRWARSHGCGALDFSGYSLVAQPGEPLWGINQFKRGFADLDQLRKSVATHELVHSPLIVASARAVRDAQARWRRRAADPEA